MLLEIPSSDFVSAVMLVIGVFGFLGLLGYGIYTAAKAPSGFLGRLSCGLRRIIRRWSWAFLLTAGLFAYPIQIRYQVWYATQQVASADRATVAAAEAAKVVDASLVFSKMSIALGVFCLINLLAWGALNMVLPVLADWAKGYYADPETAAAAGIEGSVVGFKRSFLVQEPLDRIKLYFLGFGLQLLAAGASALVAFIIQ